MKRIMIWIDSESDSVKRVQDRLKEFFSEIGVIYKIVEICDLMDKDTK